MKQFIFLLLFIISSGLSAQGNDFGILTKFSYSANLAAGDLGDRFGLHSAPGLQVDFKLTDKITLGPEFNFQFGNKVKEDVLAPIRDNLGLIIGENGVNAEIFLRQRGTYLGLNLGYLKGIGKIESGNFLHTQLSIGHWQHKIRIIDDTNSAGQFGDDYLKLYDRLSNGLAFKQILGLTHMSVRNSTNYFIQLEIMEGLTKNRRDWDAVLQAKDENSRFDISFGLRIGWILPFKENISSKGKHDVFY